jgi:hypothetical protein
LGHRLRALLLHGRYGDGGDRPAHRSFELGEGLLTGSAQHVVFHLMSLLFSSRNTAPARLAACR